MGDDGPESDGCGEGLRVSDRKKDMTPRSVNWKRSVEAPTNRQLIGETNDEFRGEVSFESTSESLLRRG